MRAEISPSDVIAIDAQYLDCCLPGYFQGTDAQEVLAIPVDNTITYREAYEACKEEFHAQSGFFDDVEDCGNMVLEALHCMFAEMLAEDTDKPMDCVKYAPSPEEYEEDCGDMVYLYVGLFAETGDE
jgi:hypothetical protein